MSSADNFSSTTTTTTSPQNVFQCITNGFSLYGSDKFSCFLFQLPFNLYNIKLGYIAAALTILIIIISLFGRIKLQYRWFILNMALIDLLNTYDFVCEKPQLFAPVLESPIHSCQLYTFLPFDGRYLVDIVPHLPSIGIFLLALSRFFGVYLPKFYEKVAKTWIVLLFIITVNILYISIIFILYKNRYDSNTEIFHTVLFFKETKFDTEIPPMEEELKKAANKKFLMVAFYGALPAIVLLLSILFFALLVIKILGQLKFQAKTNMGMFKTNIRIITVISVQIFMLCFLLPLEAIYQFDQPVSPEFQEYYPNFNFPLWVYGFISENGVRCFREIRVFIDSLIILIFMKGYREDLFATVKWILKLTKKVWRGVRYGFIKAEVKPIQRNFVSHHRSSIFTVSDVQTF